MTTAKRWFWIGADGAERKAAEALFGGPAVAGAGLEQGVEGGHRLGVQAVEPGPGGGRQLGVADPVGAAGDRPLGQLRVAVDRAVDRGQRLGGGEEQRHPAAGQHRPQRRLDLAGVLDQPDLLALQIELAIHVAHCLPHGSRGFGAESATGGQMLDFDAEEAGRETSRQ